MPRKILTYATDGSLFRLKPDPKYGPEPRYFLAEHVDRFNLRATGRLLARIKWGGGSPSVDIRDGEAVLEADIVESYGRVNGRSSGRAQNINDILTGKAATNPWPPAGEAAAA